MKRLISLRAAASLTLIAVSLFLTSCGGSSAPSTQANVLGATVDGLAQAALQQQGIPGMTVAVAKNGSMLYAQGYGIDDIFTKRPSRPPDVFEIGSVTKQFTASLIMKLQEKGQLSVDDSISLYLPEYNFPSAITLRMLLTHTSGLANFTDFNQLGDWIRNGVSETTVLTAVSQAPLEFQPGTQYSYSNSNYFALGTIIEKLSGETYASALDQMLFQPLGLTHTYYELPPASQAASGYNNDGAGLVPGRIWDRSAAFAAGALSTNVYDLVAWDAALISGKVVSAASFKEMTTSNGFELPSLSATYGFGLILSTFNSRRFIWHDGQIGGFTAATAVFPDSGFSIVVLTNYQNADPYAIVTSIMNAVCNSSQLSGNC